LTEDTKVLLGRIVAAQGLRGQVKILTFTETPENIAAYGPLSARDGRVFQIDDLRLAKNNSVIAQLSGVADRTAAEALRGTELYVFRDQLPAPSEEEWYFDDLIGLKAVYQGKDFGKVIAVHNFGASDLLEIRSFAEKKTLLLAFTEVNVPIVDINNERIIITLPEEDKFDSREE
jgi:16S rRNA processing protein RimM